MPPTATSIFEFLHEHQLCSIQRREVGSRRFLQVRHDLRTILVAYSDSGDSEALEIARRLRAAVSEWLTTPIPFDEQLVNAIGIVGSPGHVEQRWGKAVRSALDSATEAARALSGTESPARVEVRRILQQARVGGRDFRIYCHRRAAPHFQSLFSVPDEQPLMPSDFIHTSREYRGSKPFEMLVKFGPLRSFGWGAVPDSLLSAPRFQSIEQVVWSGSLDEPSFGYDPICSPDGHALVKSGSGGMAGERGDDGLRWTRTVNQVNDASDGPSPDDDLSSIDELQLFRELQHRNNGNRKAMIAQVDGEYGIALSHHAPVLSLDPTAMKDAVAFRLPVESLVEGMYIVKAAVGELDLGGLRAGEGRYSRIWKDALRGQFNADPDGLCSRLRGAGIRLLLLNSCVMHWCRPPTTVIHAPQQKRHFEILIEVLGIDAQKVGVRVRDAQVPWWQVAWREIAHARGEAIQSGMQEQHIVDEQVMEVLGRHSAEVKAGVSSGGNFQIAIQEGQALKGEIRLFRILTLEGGYEVPESTFGVIHELRELEQWRA